MSTPVAVLFARGDSVYKTLPGCDVWDLERDARKWPGGTPVVAHPPCRAWGGLRQFAKPREGERDLAIWAVEQIRRWGGVLEHPAASQLWPEMRLPAPGRRDQYGGFTVGITQHWFGHRAEKRTLLYVVGCEPGGIPVIPLSLHRAERVITHRTGVTRGHPAWRSRIDTAEREHTPVELAKWLVELARRCATNRVEVAA